MWQIADLAEWLGMRPSLLLRAREAGLSEAECLDFDLAVRAVKRTADRRSEEQEQVADMEPERDHKRRTKLVPKYPTLLAVLGLNAEPQTNAPLSEDVLGLADAFASGDVDWSTYAWGQG